MNAYLYRFCAPGQDQTNGAFSAAEQRLLAQRVSEFKQRGWPLACWVSGVARLLAGSGIALLHG